MSDATFSFAENTEGGFDIIKTEKSNTVFIAEVKTEAEAKDLIIEFGNIQISYSEEIPVFHGDKIYIVSLKKSNIKSLTSGVQGRVIAECLEFDDANYILDFIN